MTTVNELCKKIDELNVLCVKPEKTWKGILFVLFKISAMFLLISYIIKLSYDHSVGIFFIRRGLPEYQKLDFTSAMLFVFITTCTKEASDILSKNLRNLEIVQMIKKKLTQN